MRLTIHLLFLAYDSDLSSDTRFRWSTALRDTGVPFRPNDVVLTPDMWRRLFRNGWDSLREFYDEFRDVVAKDRIRIKPVPPPKGRMGVWWRVVRGYTYGYLMFDVMYRHTDYSLKISKREKYPMAFVFEELVETSIRQVLLAKWPWMRRNVVRVDKAGRDYRRLDYVVVNQRGKWRIGIQCKKYVNLTTKGGLTGQEGAQFMGTSFQHVIRVESELRKKHRSKVFCLFFWYAYRKNLSEPERKKRIDHLKERWHEVVYFDRGEPNQGYYEPTLEGFSKFRRYELWRAKDEALSGQH